MLRKIHKIIGASVCLIIIHLSVTGLILMFPSHFNLYNKYYTSSWLLSAFNMYTYSDVRFSSYDENLILVGSNLVVEDDLITLNIEKIVSAFKVEKDIIIVAENSILLVNEKEFGFDSVLIESFNKPILEAGVSTHGNFIIQQESNRFELIKNMEKYLLSITDQEYEKIVLSKVNKEKSAFYLNLIQGPGVQALRLVTELHNGRFFGAVAVLIFSITTLAAMFLSLSGFYMTMRPLLRKFIKFNLKKNSKKRKGMPL